MDSLIVHRHTEVDQILFGLSREAIYLWKEEIELLCKENSSLMQVRIVKVDGKVELNYDKFNGVKLSNFIKEYADTLTEKDIILIIQQICWGIQAIHSAGFIHRDIGLSNIWISKSRPFAVKVGDFELMNKVSSYKTKNVLGTGFYAPNEQVLKEGIESYSLDIYSIGITLAYLLLKQCPNITNDIFDIKTLEQEMRTRYGAQVFDIVNKAVNVNPDDRYQNVSEFADELITEIVNNQKAVGEESPQLIEA